MAETERKRPGWLNPALAVVAVLLAAGAVGFGIGYLSRSDDSGPDLTRDEAFAQARSGTAKAVSREMARRGLIAGKRSGHSHGVIAGGMAAESAATIVVRQQRASVAQSQAASAQSELSGMTAAPAPPTPTVSPPADG
jgi:hypothetical protein